MVSSSPPEPSLSVVPLWVLVNPFSESRGLKISGLSPVGGSEVGKEGGKSVVGM